jgi:mannose-6-phosphate isomerase class I
VERETGRRRTAQHLLPLRKPAVADGAYDPYPCAPLGAPLGRGYRALADLLRRHPLAVLDGFGGVFWDEVREGLEACLREAGVRTAWLDVAQALRSPDEVEALVAPSLGGDDPLVGTRFAGRLEDFFVPEELAARSPDPAADLTIVYGCGAALTGWDALLVYLDVPKNEIQYRSRAMAVTNLGAAAPAEAKATYKRCYFVDWPVLNRHKRDLLPRIDVIVDSQRPGEPVFASGGALRDALAWLGRDHFRVRPWFEPGAWGGRWIRERVPALAQDVPNYAWSFELIVPENGLLFEHDGLLLEVSFDLLMFQEAPSVLGHAEPRFGDEFPIRFDWLDTVGGGNLSLQCHPSPSYIRRHFGERFTQDETYYVLAAEPGAKVYLGFQEGVDPVEFRAALERSARDGTPVDVERFVQTEAAEPHRLFLIPHGTVHCSGAGVLVLEISATPYIFTFKLYDWLRLDLDGRPRPLNIDRAFANLDLARQGPVVQEELVSHPRVVAHGEDWLHEHLPTHRDHHYDVHRFTFASPLTLPTSGACHVMSVVSGGGVRLDTATGGSQRFGYAETFVVAAGAGSYTLSPEGSDAVTVVQAFVRPEG